MLILIFASLFFVTSVVFYVPVKPSSTNFSQSSKRVAQHPTSLLRYLPQSYVRDGSVDYTRYIQQLIDENRNITIPGFPILINDGGIKIKSGRTIEFEKGSVLLLKPSRKTKYSMLHLENITNVRLIAPVLSGDRFSHLGSEGEWGMGIGIYSCSNITIIDPKIRNCWGDGIYLGRTNYVNKNIRIINAHLTFNRRDGISVISVNGLNLEDCYSGYNNGTLPMTGINFEPNSSKDEIDNVVVTNPVTEHNGSNGIQFTLGRLLSSIGKKYINIKVINHKDRNSGRFPFKFTVSRRPHEPGEISGSVDIVRPNWRNYGEKPIYFSLSEGNVKVSLFSPILAENDGKHLSPDITRSRLKKSVRMGQLIIN